MKNLLEKLPFLIIALYASASNISRFNPLLMPWLAGAVFASMLLVQLFLRRNGGEISTIGSAMLAYAGLNAAVFLLFQDQAGPLLTAYMTGTLYVLFFAWTFIPAFFRGRYFTEYFARKSSPPSVWESEPFKIINRNMTYGWTAIFAIAAILAALPVMAGLTGPAASKGALLAFRLLFQVVLPLGVILAVGVPFTRNYPARYMKKLGIEMPGETPAETGKEIAMETKLKVVAINGSPKGAVGNTSRIVSMVAEALTGHGVELEEIFLSEKRIEYCVGCGHCLEKSRCWRNDDHGRLTDLLSSANGVILASPVYFGAVTAQMKAFIDRALTLGHKPRTTWKPGLAISVSAGKGESDTGRYLARVLHPFGAFPVGILTAIAVRPGDFTGEEWVRARAADLARDLAVAIKEKRRYPVTDEDFGFYLFMRELVSENRDFMTGDYEHWRKNGLLENFSAYSGQTAGKTSVDLEERREWIREMMREEAAKARGTEKNASPGGPGRYTGSSCLELIRSMPMGFHPEKAGDLAAVIQFSMSGAETFEAYLDIRDGRCLFNEGRAEKPSITIKAPSEVWLAIARGELNGQSAFMAGKFRTEGDMGLLMRMKTLFG